MNRKYMKVKSTFVQANTYLVQDYSSARSP
jgi:hypothetical protein